MGIFGCGFSLMKTASITEGEMKGKNIMKQTAEKIESREPETELTWINCSKQ
jgi:hypothetical protein